MPFYEYSCAKCGAEKEVLHGINDKPEVACEVCGDQTMERLISAAGFRLKGGGWYETDFKSDKRRNVASDGTGTSSGGKSDDGGAGSSDSGSTKASDGGAAKSSDSGSSTGSSAASTSAA
ncbi:zinc ribbon domain-containing protein [Algiphilus sp.]|uniref:FmdB family zinc ribbon protein n=1 Tax=Algiphilus sp. TaxID=1872431 RepID=UPI0025C65FC4|nr:zinc ribbon domain-containing protein [Algiphilus sp.]MCK5771023.1 zinc ribbon domain-containing protein [Algiphilus sp.]